VHRRCAGIDISKKDAKVCVRVQGSGRRTTTASVTIWGAMSNEILALREHLIAEKVTCVVMESTGDYWKPFYYLLEDAVNVMLINPRDARNRPGRKTDLPARCRRGCVPYRARLARFATRDQRCGCAA
jgi:transposase